MEHPPPQQPPTQPLNQPPEDTSQPGFQPSPVRPARGVHWFALSQIRGFPLVNIDSGEKIGEVGDVLLDDHLRVAQAFVTKAGFLHLRGSSYVPLANASIGTDAITVQPRAVTEQDTAHMKRLPKASEMIGTRVLSNIGEFIGTIADVHFDQSDGTLLAFEIKPEGAALRQRLLGSQNLTLPVSGVISFGEHLIVDANTVAGL